MMMRNYRSTPEILAAANCLIDKNRNRMRKELAPTLPSGAPVTWLHCESPEAEAAAIAGRIAELHESGIPYRDIAILYRAHYVTRSIEEVFLRLKLPYVCLLYTSNKRSDLKATPFRPLPQYKTQAGSKSSCYCLLYTSRCV